MMFGANADDVRGESVGQDMLCSPFCSAYLWLGLPTIGFHKICANRQLRVIMVRINRSHTGVGDGGRTRHLDGSEVSKADSRLEVVGSIDELNSIVGVVRMELERMPTTTSDGGPRATVRRMRRGISKKLERVQHELFDLGAECSQGPDSLPESIHLISQRDCDQLLTEMDEWVTELEPLESFILPTGNPLVANLHHARAVARRVERRLASHRDTIGADSPRPEVVSYLNRLSDWFFTICRWVNHTLGEDEELWTPHDSR